MALSRGAVRYHVPRDRSPVPAVLVGALVVVTLVSAQLSIAGEPSRSAPASTAAASVAEPAPSGAAPAAGESAAPAGDGELDAVTVGVIPIVDVAPIYLGQQEGFFEEEGIELTLETGQGGAAIVPGVVSGQFQFGFSNITSLLVARTSGLPLKVVTSGVTTTGVEGEDFAAIVVPEGSDITGPEDLGGTTIAVNTLNNIGDTTVRYTVEQAGGDPDSIEFLELPFPDMPAALAEGRVDAAWILEPFLTISKQQGATEIASNYAVTDPDLLVAAYFSSEELLASDPDLVERFTTAMNRSLDYAQENPDAARAVLAEYTEIDPAVSEALVLPRWSSEIDPAPVQLLADLALDDGLVQEEADVEGLLP